MVWNVTDPDLYHPDHLVVRHMYDADHAAVVWFGFKSGQALRTTKPQAPRSSRC